MTEFLAALVVLSAVAWMLIDGRSHWVVKAFFIVALVSASLVIFGRISKYKGSPREVSELPIEFIHVSSVVDEPNGFIYLWMKDIDSTRIYPTSVKIAYNRQIHKAAQKGKEATKGKPFKMSLEKAQGGNGSGAEGSPGGEGAGQGQGGMGQGSGSSGTKGSGSLSLESIGGASIGIVPPSSMPIKEN